MDAQQTALGVSGAAGALAALGYLFRKAARVNRRMLEVTDVILGSDQHKPLAQRLDDIEHELHTNNGASLRDVADRVEQVAKQLRVEQRKNATESRRRRDQDREVMERLAARIDALWTEKGQ